MRDLVYYVATTIDGFIADPDGDPEFLHSTAETARALFERLPESCPTHLRDAFGVTAEPARFDTVILGARTHRPALEAGLTSAYPHLSQLVVTHDELPEDPAVQRVSGDIAAVVRELKARPGRDIWLCGGGDLAGQLHDEIDELQVKINPVVAGSGTPLFSGGFRPSYWRCTGVERMPDDVILVSYRRIGDAAR